MPDKFSFLKEALETRQGEGNKRELPDLTDKIDFWSNDYLGLSRNPELTSEINAIWSSDESYQLGGTGSRLISGNHATYHQLEGYMDELLGAKTLVFNSGYAANQGLISSVASRDDTIIYDRLAHVCIKEGAWLSRGKTFAFSHNDVEDLDRRLSQSQGRVFVVTESIFSMDGDQAPIEEILTCCERYGAYLIVDEAHSTGTHGQGGAGLVHELGLTDRLFATVLTFGKAIGSHGACVVGSQDLRDFLVNFARTFIYTTSLPPHNVLAIDSAFKYIKSHPEVQQDLETKIGIFKQVLKEQTGLETISDSAVQPIMIPGNQRCTQVADHLNEKGFAVKAIKSPTVRSGEERLRISLHVHNTVEEIQMLVKELKEVI